LPSPLRFVVVSDRGFVPTEMILGEKFTFLVVFIQVIHLHLYSNCSEKACQDPGLNRAN
jgi:hypothetical protein